jgi:ubiquitin carboxyl-terminal hydrolase MINDY-1/2
MAETIGTLTFRTRLIEYFNRNVRIILQNSFGPCALLGVVNILLLENRISIDRLLHCDGSETIRASHLVECIADYICSKRDLHKATGAAESFEIDSVLQLLPSLIHGLDINIKFDYINSMEFTSTLHVFDALRCRLYHGWCYDPQDEKTVSVFSGKSYNQVINELIEYKSANEGEIDSLMQKGEIIQNFMESSASQLTFTGLTCLHEEMHEGDLAVLYRNQHFSTIIKKNDYIYSLVTDEGYQFIFDVVWERLESIDGDTRLFDGNFMPYEPEMQNVAPTSVLGANINTGNSAGYGGVIAIDPQNSFPLMQHEQQQQQQRLKRLQEQEDGQLARMIAAQEEQEARGQLQNTARGRTTGRGRDRSRYGRTANTNETCNSRNCSIS